MYSRRGNKEQSSLVLTLPCNCSAKPCEFHKPAQGRSWNYVGEWENLLPKLQSGHCPTKELSVSTGVLDLNPWCASETCSRGDGLSRLIKWEKRCSSCPAYQIEWSFCGAIPQFQCGQSHSSINAHIKRIHSLRLKCMFGPMLHPWEYFVCNIWCLDVNFQFCWLIWI